MGGKQSSKQSLWLLLRDHLLVINSILQEVSQDKSKNIDIGIYDVNAIISSVLTSHKCSVQIDSLGKDFLKNKKNKDILHKYLDVISIPPLSMVDDILTVSEAGTKFIIMNASVQSKMDAIIGPIKMLSNKYWRQAKCNHPWTKYQWQRDKDLRKRKKPWRYSH